MAKLTNELESVKFKMKNGELHQQSIDVELDGDVNDYNDYSIYITVNGIKSDLTKLFSKLGLFTEVVEMAKIDELLLID